MLLIEGSQEKEQTGPDEEREFTEGRTTQGRRPRVTALAAHLF